MDHKQHMKRAGIEFSMKEGHGLFDIHSLQLSTETTALTKAMCIDGEVYLKGKWHRKRVSNGRPSIAIADLNRQRVNELIRSNRLLYDSSVFHLALCWLYPSSGYPVTCYTWIGARTRGLNSRMMLRSAAYSTVLHNVSGTGVSSYKVLAFPVQSEFAKYHKMEGFGYRKFNSNWYLGSRPSKYALILWQNLKSIRDGTWAYACDLETKALSLELYQRFS